MNLKFAGPLLFLGMVLSQANAEAVNYDKAYDYLLKNATVYDGRSPRPLKMDVGISGDYIAHVGEELKAEDAVKVIELRGFILTPGFIDAHTHSDFNPLVYPELGHKLVQGVTTEVIGNCGMSAAPILGPHAEKYRKIWAREGVDLENREILWTQFKEYREALAALGLQTNFIGLIGHGNIRNAVIGSAPRPASRGEIEEMKQIVAEAMKQGAFGISFGLVYLPGLYAQETELVELCREAACFKGVCAFHLRSESSALVEALQEVLRIGEKAQAKIQISHLKAAGKSNFSKIDEAFRMIEQARLSGQRVVADAYPYTASFAELGVILPDDLFEREDRDPYFQNPLHQAGILERLRTHYERQNRDWGQVVIAATPHPGYQKYQGKSIKQIAREKNEEAEKFLLDILTGTHFEVSAFNFSQNEEVLRKVLTKPYVAVGSDSIADGSTHPHPRAYASFPKMIRDYVREAKLLSLGVMIRKMTSLPAEHFGIRERGFIRPGYFADLLVFDPSKIEDRADYQNPREYAKGMEWVFLNGEPVVEKGEWKGKKSGQFLFYQP